MSKLRLHFVLGVLALLATTAHGNPPSDTSGCNAQAWVRAPDLTPNTIVHGDARVKISAECPDVNDVFLGLRFKERSFVKALRSREDAKRLHPEHPWVVDGLSDTSPWAVAPSRFANRSVQDAYEEVLTNKDLWIVREEERLVFETTHPMNMWNKNHGIHRDTVQNFTILVPSTNFPPALNNFNLMNMVYAGIQEVVEAEWMYEYFAKITFANGTTRDISAGVTTFQPLHNPTYISDKLASATAELRTTNFFGNLEKCPLTTNYSVEVSGLEFSAGTKSHPVTVVITRTGPLGSSSVPLNISVCVSAELTFEWAAEYGTDTNVANLHHLSPLILRATSCGSKHSRCTWGNLLSCQNCQKVAVTMPNLTSDETQADAIVTTKSPPVTLFVNVDEDHVPTFEGYYQALANSLVITLETPRTEDDPGDFPFSEPAFIGRAWPLFEDDEEEWVPWERAVEVRPNMNFWKSYTGRVPVVVHPFAEGTSSDFPAARVGALEQVILTNGERYKQPSLTHYLAQDARGPIFIDSDAAADLLTESPAERQLHAPILVPLVSSPPEGEEAVQRYYRHLDPKKPLIYVGKTWAKRVAHLKDESSPQY